MIFRIMIVAAVAASKLAEAEAQRRRALGIPDPPAPSPSPPDRWGDFMFWALILLPGLLMAGVVGLFILGVFRILFAMRGETFP